MPYFMWPLLAINALLSNFSSCSRSLSAAKTPYKGVRSQWWAPQTAEWFDVARRGRRGSEEPVSAGKRNPVISMSRYIPVSTNMDSEDHYHSPYDTNELESEVRIGFFYWEPIFFVLFRLTMRHPAVSKEIHREASSSPQVEYYFSSCLLKLE